MDADCVRITCRGRSARISIDVSRRRLVTVKDVFNVCDGLAQVVGKLRAEDASMNVWLDRFDLSQNGLGNDALTALAKALLHHHAGVPRVLLLWQNCISDATPLLELFAAGRLQQLHLSGNMLSGKATVSLAVAAVLAKRSDGTLAYPFVYKQRKTPLWLRLENQRGVGCCKHGGFLDAIEAVLQPAGIEAQDAICFVQGNCLCCPELCCCRAIVPAVHLTYLNVSQLRGRARRELPLPVGTTKTRKWQTVRRSPGVGAGGVTPGGGRRAVEQTAREGGWGVPGWLQPLPPPGLESCHPGGHRSSEPWPARQSRQDLVPHAVLPAVAESFGGPMADSGDGFRAVTCDYAGECAACMSVRLGDVVVAGSVTDYEGYVFALDPFNDKSGYVPVSALSA